MTFSRGENEIDSCDKMSQSYGKIVSKVTRKFGCDINLLKRPLLLSSIVFSLILFKNLPIDCLTINVRSSSPTRADSQHNVGATNKPTITYAKLLQSDVDPMAYLQRYGYMNGTGNSSSNLMSEDSFLEAIVSFQRFAGIPETGSLDPTTIKYMQMPRCGNKDQSGKGENGKRRRKRYALQGSKWKRQELTYRISQYPTRFLYKKQEVDSQIEKAFKIWSQVAPINFVPKKEGRVHIDIRFANGEHGDGDPFDGPGNTLAHAYFPQYGGDAHFDDQEYWTVDSYAGTNIFQVAAHELGHSLGLGHSSVREALMAPFYQKYKPNFKLHADDILAIQALYGERGPDDEQPPSTVDYGSPSTTADPTEGRRRYPGSRTSTTTTSTTPAPEDDGGFFGFGGGSKPVDLCQDSAIDAITRTEDGNTYVFRGQHYWQIKNEGLASGYPAKISRDWEGLPANLDAALTWSDGKTFFFKGDKYWRYFNKRREPGYPKPISAGFAGIPNNVDAAFVWSGNGKTYFFKKDKYWRFDSKQEPPVSSQYPKSIKNWSGLPLSGIDGAFKWDNGMTYFFKDGQYYRFDDREFEVDSSARPTFPRSTAEWWFGCTNSNLPIRSSGSGSGSIDNLDSLASSLMDFANNDPPSSKNRPSHNYDSSTGSTSTTAKPSGSSISRSIFSSLSSIFPSSFIGGSSDSAQATNESQQLQQDKRPSIDDWSFHKGTGAGEEDLIRRPEGHHGIEPRFSRPTNSFRPPSRRVEPVSDSSTRWLFPLSRDQSRGEQSLSELRMDPKES